jgi:hypothetical protein
MRAYAFADRYSAWRCRRMRYSPPFEEDFSIGDCAEVLWALMDHLQVPRGEHRRVFPRSAVVLAMALQRPQSVARLALINTLLSYRIDHWRKWLEARVPAILIRLIGMRCANVLAAGVAQTCS